MRKIGWLLSILLSAVADMAAADVNWLSPWDDVDAARSQPPSGYTSAQTIFEEPGVLIAVEARRCWDRNGFILYFKSSLHFPAYVNNGTLYQNGWWFTYTGDDHHVNWVQSIIYMTRFLNSSLEWVGVAGLHDKQWNEYDFCQTVIAIGWNQDRVSITPLGATINAQSDNKARPSGVVSIPGGSMPDERFSRQLSWNQFLREYESLPLLPLGFSSSFCDFNDHHLLQMAYDQGNFHRGKWHSSQGYMRDQRWRAICAADYNTALTGPTIAMAVAPLLRIRPHAPPTGSCISVGNPQTTEEVKTGLPYALAVPVLAGWDLYYNCGNDEHVREIGVQIYDVHYDKPSNDLGILRYKITRALRDNDYDPRYSARIRVNTIVLGQ
jgi:hypothetical protein